MLLNFSLITGLLMFLPILTVPFSQTKPQMLRVYALTSLLLFSIHFLFKTPFMKEHVKSGLYAGFSIFIAFSMYLSLVHTPNMRATILLICFCIMPMGFIDAPNRINAFIVTWFLIHSLLAFYFKPTYAMDDITNTLGSMLIGIFIGNKMLWMRLEGYEAYRLRTIERETDALTGLFNRRKLFELIALNETEELSARPIVALMIDIDHFKVLNDTLGHAQGDEYLKLVGISLRYFAKAYHLEIFRYGGEGFLILAHWFTQEDLVRLAEEIRLSIQEIQVANFQPSASIGIAFAPNNKKRNLEHVINLADKAVYSAKYNCRDQIEYLIYH